MAQQTKPLLEEARGGGFPLVCERELLAAVVSRRVASDAHPLDHSALVDFVGDALVRERAIVPHDDLVGAPRDARAELGLREPFVDELEDGARLGWVHTIDVRGEGR